MKALKSNRILSLILTLCTGLSFAAVQYSTILTDALKTSDAFTFDQLINDWKRMDEHFYNSDNFATLAERVAADFSGTPSELSDAVAQYKSSGASDNQWKDLYAEICAHRRKSRLNTYINLISEIVFAKKGLDRRQQYCEHNRGYEPSELSLLEIDDNTACKVSTLYAADGAERDPCVSFDGTKILFAQGRQRYHLYELDLNNNNEVRQITFNDAGGEHNDLNGIYLPNGDIMFSSGRSRVKVPCNGGSTMNLYLCNGDGQYIRRIGFDQASDFFLTLLPDGRALFTRWGYNDRERWDTFDLFYLHPDGTNQRGYYGNATCFPQIIACPKPIPGTNKVMVICTGKEEGHLSGPMAIVSYGSDDYEFVATKSDPNIYCGAEFNENDLNTIFNTSYDYKSPNYSGPYVYPYPLNEDAYIVSVRDGTPKFGLCLVFRDASRELLAYDTESECMQGQVIAPWSEIWGDPKPPVLANKVDYRKTTANCFIQDIYIGRAMEGVQRGAVKRLRIAALEYRLSGKGSNIQLWDGSSSYASPSLKGGAWDVKQIIGETPVFDDGSVACEVPANTPIYFQALDEKGKVIQSMREWVTFMPGENASCIGCHESPHETPPAQQPTATTPVPLDDFYGPPRGFSFNTEIQPILDQHCIECHNGSPYQGKTIKNLTDEDVMIKDRNWNKSYLELIGYDETCEYDCGSCVRFPIWKDSPVSYYGFDDPPEIVPPGAIGSLNSPLITMLENGHNNVQLSDEEMRKIACWIDLAIPFAGSYEEGLINNWDAYHRSQRQDLEKWLEIERANIEAYIQVSSVSSDMPHYKAPHINTKNSNIIKDTRISFSDIHFSVPDNLTKVNISLINPGGKIVRNLCKTEMAAGNHKVRITNSRNTDKPLPAGCYLCEITIGNQRTTLQYVHVNR